jgi:hypothetical protein
MNIYNNINNYNCEMIRNNSNVLGYNTILKNKNIRNIIINSNIFMYIGLLKITTVGKQYIPITYQKMNEHYGIIIPHKGSLFTNILTSNYQPMKIDSGLKFHFLNHQNIIGLNKNQYVWSPAYKINNKLFDIIKDSKSNQYFIEHYEKFQQVLKQINKNGFDPNTVIDLVSYLPEFLQK